MTTLQKARSRLIMIRSYLEKIQEQVAKGETAYDSDYTIKDTIILNFMFVSDSTTQLPEDWKAAHPEVEWPLIRGLRNKIAHEYPGLDDTQIWDIVAGDDLRSLAAAIETMCSRYLR